MNKKNITEKIDIEKLITTSFFDSKTFKHIDNFNNIFIDSLNSTFLSENIDEILNFGFKLSKVKIKNFKSIREETFDFNETTLLSGKNSAGKSSFTHAILLIAQWMGGYADSRNGYMPLNGELIQLGTTEDVYFKGKNKADTVLPFDKNLNTYKSIDPIEVNLYFEQKDPPDIEREYKVVFKFLPEFRNLKKSELKTVISASGKEHSNFDHFAINKKPEVELIEFSSELTFLNDQFKKVFIDNLLRSSRTVTRRAPKIFPNIGKEIFKIADTKRGRKQIIDLDLEDFPEKLSILRKYKKYQIDADQFNTRNFLGSFLTNFRNSHKFYFAPLSNSKISIYTNTTKYGDHEDFEYLISPNKLKIGNNLTEPDSLVNLNDETLIKAFIDDDYLNSIENVEDNLTKTELSNLKKYIDGPYKKLEFQRIVSGNNIAIRGKDLVKFRLVSDIFNNIQSEDSPLIIDNYFKKRNLEQYKQGLLKFEDKTTNKKYLDNEIKIRQAFRLNPETKGKRRILSDNKIDETIWFLIAATENRIDQGKLVRGYTPEQLDDNKGLIYSRVPSRAPWTGRGGYTSRNLQVKELIKRFETTTKHSYIKSIYENISPSLFSDFIFSDQPHREWRANREIEESSEKKLLTSEQRKYFRLLQNFMQSILETEFRNETWRERSVDDIQSRIKLAGIKVDDLAQDIVNLHCEFEKILDNLVESLNSQSEKLWEILISQTSISTNSVPSMSDSVISHLIKQSILEIYENIFRKESETDAIRAYYILKLCLPTISNQMFSNLLLRLSNKDFINNIENDKLKFSDSWTIDSVNSGNNLEVLPFFPLTECHYNVKKLKKEDVVFISLDKNLYSLEQVPQTSLSIPFKFENVTFLSGVLSRNSLDTRSFVTSYTPIGFHGGKLASELYNNQDKILSAPIPNTLEIFDNPISRSKYLNNKDKFNRVGLDKSKFLHRGEFKDHLNFWLRHLELGDSVIVDRGDSLMQSRIKITQDKYSSKYDELYNLGSGVSQALPILSHVLLSENKTIFLEEIEQNLHASAQAKIADFILIMSLANNRRFLIETHSEHIINRIRLRTLQLAKSPYEFDDKNPFNIYFAIKNNNGSKLTQMRIDESGDFIDDYPKGFFDQAQLDILKIISEKN